MSRTIIGLRYKSMDEIDAGIKFARSSNGGKFGLELTENYIENVRNGIEFLILGDIEKKLRNDGKDVLYLNDRKLYKEFRSCEIAKAVNDGILKRSDIELTYHNLSNPRKFSYLPPEKLYHYSVLFERYKRAIEIIDSRKNIEDLFRNSLMEQRAFMSDRIKQENPDVVYMGIYQARKLVDNVLGYRLIDINSIK